MIYLILLVGMVVRLISLNQSLWLDEATTAMVSKMSLSNIFTKFLPGDFHPPLYYLIIKFWTSIFGYSEVALRIPSVIFGVVSTYIIYLIGKKMFNAKVGLIASIFASTSGLLIYYSQEARMYSLVVLLVTFAILTFIQKKWIIFSITLMLLGLTDYVPLFIIPIFYIFSLKDWKKITLSLIPLLISYAIWFPIFIQQFLGGLLVNSTSPLWWKILGETSLKNLALIPTKFIFGRVSLDNKILYAVLDSLLCIIFFYFIYLGKNIKNSSKRLICLWIMVPILFAAVIGLKIPILTYFRLIFVLPAMYLLIAVGLSTLNKRFFMASIVFVLVVNFSATLSYLVNPVFQREDWRSLVGFVESKKTENSVTIFVADSNMEAYRYYAPNAKIAGPGAIKSGYDQIWLMRYLKDVFDAKDKAKVEIENLGYTKTGEYSFNGVDVWEYEAKIQK